jgi:hypothetical protein
MTGVCNSFGSRTAFKADKGLWGPNCQIETKYFFKSELDFAHGHLPTAMGVRRLFYKGGQNFPGGASWGGPGGKNIMFVLKMPKTYYFISKKSKNILFGPAKWARGQEGPGIIFLTSSTCAAIFKDFVSLVLQSITWDYSFWSWDRKRGTNICYDMAKYLKVT